MHHLCLIIERDKSAAHAMQRDFPLFGFKPYAVETLAAALELLRQWQFDVVLLDAEACGDDHLRVLRKLQSCVTVPVVLLSAARGEPEQIKGLESGASDIVFKPASMRLITAKLRRLVEVGQRAAQAGEPEIRLGPLRLDLRRGIAWVDDERLELTRHQFDLLALLAAHAGELVHRDTIAMALGSPIHDMARSADVHVYRIRKKLKEAGVHGLQLDTIHGRGYCLSLSGGRSLRSPESAATPVHWAS